MKIKEIIVVEGKNDTNVLQSCIDCDTIETHGTHLSVETLRLIEQAAKTRGVIIPGKSFVLPSIRKFPAVKMHISRSIKQKQRRRSV